MQKISKGWCQHLTGKCSSDNQAPVMAPLGRKATNEAERNDRLQFCTCADAPLQGQALVGGSQHLAEDAGVLHCRCQECHQALLDLLSLVQPRTEASSLPFTPLHRSQRKASEGIEEICSCLADSNAMGEVSGVPTEGVHLPSCSVQGVMRVI